MQTQITDFEKHNAEVKATWDAYRAGSPTRTPMIIGTNVRFSLANPDVNTENLSFEKYMSDPQIMLDFQAKHHHWIRHHIPQDMEMGLPSVGWNLGVEFQNIYEAAWFGCPIEYHDDQVPDTRPILDSDATKNLLFERGQPDPFSGLMQKNWEFYDFLKNKQNEGWTYQGRPIASVNPCGLGTDGPLTVACNIRGATEFMTDLIEDPEYALKLMDFITTGTIRRIQAYRARLGLPLKNTEAWGFADDSVQLISTGMYQEMILPFHQRLKEALSEAPKTSIHLCGDSTRHFQFLRDNMGITSFDTGFPVNFSKLREHIGPDVEILGGPQVALLISASAKEIYEESKRILTSGIRNGGRFVFREGNNLPPGVPLENLHAMYAAAKEFGQYN
jgi:hypothetical protein